VTTPTEIAASAAEAEPGVAVVAHAGTDASALQLLDDALTASGNETFTFA